VFKLFKKVFKCSNIVEQSLTSRFKTIEKWWLFIPAEWKWPDLKGLIWILALLYFVDGGGRAYETQGFLSAKITVSFWRMFSGF